MPYSTAHLEVQIYDLLGLQEFEECTCHYHDPNTDEGCTVRLSQLSNHNIRTIVRIFAIQSPSNILTDCTRTQGFCFLENLARPANSCLCLIHATPIRITHLILVWLWIVVQRPDVFQVNFSLQTLRPDLHRILTLLASRYEPQLWTRVVALWFYALDVIAQRGLLVEHPGAISIPSRDHVQSLVQDIISALAVHDLEQQEFEDYLRDTTDSLPDSPLSEGYTPTYTENGIVIPSSRPLFPRPTTPAIPDRAPGHTYTANQGGDREPNRRPPPSPSPPSSTPATPTDDDDEDCPICTDPMHQSQRTISCTTCRQNFHLLCIQTWASYLIDDGRDATCPCCRRVWDEDRL